MGLQCQLQLLSILCSCPNIYNSLWHHHSSPYPPSVYAQETSIMLDSHHGDHVGIGWLHHPHTRHQESTKHCDGDCLPNTRALSTTVDQCLRLHVVGKDGIFLRARAKDLVGQRHKNRQDLRLARCPIFPNAAGRRCIDPTWNFPIHTNARNSSLYGRHRPTTTLHPNFPLHRSQVPPGHEPKRTRTTSHRRQATELENTALHPLRISRPHHHQNYLPARRVRIRSRSRKEPNPVS